MCSTKCRPPRISAICAEERRPRPRSDPKSVNKTNRIPIAMGWFSAVGTVVLAVVVSFGLLATFQALGYVTDTIPYSFVGPDHPPDYLGKVNMMVWSSATFMVVCGIFAAMIWIGAQASVGSAAGR